MPTPRRTSPGRANAEKARTTPRAGAIRAFKFGKRMDAKGVSRTGTQQAATKPSSTPKPTPTPKVDFGRVLKGVDLLRRR